MCYDYLKAYYIIKYFKFAVPLLIEAINLVVKLATKFFAEWIRYDNVSRMISQILTIEFVLNFFNQGIIITIANANLRSTEYDSHYLDGQYSDFTKEWFVHLAPLFINPFFIAFIFPFIQTSVKYCQVWAKDLWDRRFTAANKHMTNCLTTEEYADIKSAEHFEINSQYPKIMTIIMVCMVYGFGLPVLFPLTLVFLCITYCAHKLFIVYWYRKPPMYDDTLNKICLYYIKYGALLYALISYWQLTNRQMFYNETIPKESKDEPEVSNH